MTEAAFDVCLQATSVKDFQMRALRAGWPEFTETGLAFSPMRSALPVPGFADQAYEIGAQLVVRDGERTFGCAISPPASYNLSAYTRQRFGEGITPEGSGAIFMIEREGVPRLRSEADINNTPVVEVIKNLGPGERKIDVISYARNDRRWWVDVYITTRAD